MDRSLIVYCLSGGPYLQMLELSLQSLLAFGQFPGTVLVVTEADAAEVRQFVPTLARLRSTIQYRDFQRRGRNALLSRYELHECHPIVVRSAPILYVDADVLFDAPIGSLMRAVACLDRLAVASESWTDRNRDTFMGAELIRFAGLDSAGFGLNSGAIGIPNGDDPTTREHLREIGETTRMFSRNFPNRLGHTHDQAVLTFLQARDGNYDGEVLTSFINFNGQPSSNPLADRRGIVHFLYDDKIARMRGHLRGLMAGTSSTNIVQELASSLPSREATDGSVITSSNLW